MEVQSSEKHAKTESFICEVPSSEFLAAPLPPLGRQRSSLKRRADFNPQTAQLFRKIAVPRYSPKEDFMYCRCFCQMLSKHIDRRGAQIPHPLFLPLIICVRQGQINVVQGERNICTQGNKRNGWSVDVHIATSPPTPHRHPISPSVLQS
jgi:hypothetical protein